MRVFGVVRVSRVVGSNRAWLAGEYLMVVVVGVSGDVDKTDEGNAIIMYIGMNITIISVDGISCLTYSRAAINCSLGRQEKNPNIRLNNSMVKTRTE